MPTSFLTAVLQSNHVRQRCPRPQPRDVAAQLVGRVELAVHVAEEAQVGDAERLGGRGLLGPADRRHLRARQVAVVAAGLAVGAQAVRHLDARVGPAGDGAARAEVDVVGVGGDDQDAFDVGVVEH